MEVLRCDLCCCTMEGRRAAEPFVEDHPHCVLVAGRTWLALDLLRCHIGDRADDLLRVQRTRTVSHYSDAKVAEQDVVVPAQ